jgi:large subunit ribosomal protein L33
MYDLPVSHSLSTCNSSTRTRALPSFASLLAVPYLWSFLLSSVLQLYHYHYLVNIYLASSNRTLIVRLISTAQTGFFYTTQRPRLGPRLSAVKYDPKGTSCCLFYSSVLLYTRSHVLGAYVLYYAVSFLPSHSAIWPPPTPVRKAPFAHFQLFHIFVLPFHPWSLGTYTLHYCLHIVLICLVSSNAP